MKKMGMDELHRIWRFLAEDSAASLLSEGYQRSNVVARLRELGKGYGRESLVAEEVYNQVADEVERGAR